MDGLDSVGGGMAVRCLIAAAGALSLSLFAIAAVAAAIVATASWYCLLLSIFVVAVDVLWRSRSGMSASGAVTGCLLLVQ